MINYSGITAGLTSYVFGLRKQSSGLPLFFSLSLRPSTQPSTYRQVQPNLSCQPAALLTCASETPPKPNRALMTDGSGSSTNIHKISLFS